MFCQVGEDPQGADGARFAGVGPTARSVISALLALVTLVACSDADAPAPTTGAIDPVPATRRAEEAVTTICDGLALVADHRVSSAAALTEISGAAVSRRSADAIWVHEDSGNAPVLTELALDGSLLSRWTVPGVEAVDWEDMARATSPDGGEHLFVGDIGDNLARRPHVSLLRLDEPTADGTSTAPPAVLRLVLPDGPRDAEALLVDHPSGDVVVVTKSITGVADVLVGPGAAWSPDGTVVALEHAGTLRLGPGQAVLAGDVSPDGTVLALRTPARVLLWERDGSLPVATTLLRTEPCRAPAIFDIVGEALALLDEGYVLAGEGDRPSLVLVR
jgi:hypothetical protein